MAHVHRHRYHMYDLSRDLHRGRRHKNGVGQYGAHHGRWKPRSEIILVSSQPKVKKIVQIPPSCSSEVLACGAGSSSTRGVCRSSSIVTTYHPRRGNCLPTHFTPLAGIERPRRRVLPFSSKASTHPIRGRAHPSWMVRYQSRSGRPESGAARASSKTIQRWKVVNSL